MAFRKKAPYILAYKPDILVIPECENPERLNFGKSVKVPTDIIWHGSNPHKGLGVFSYNKDLKLKLLDVHNDEFRIVLPIEVTGGQYQFILFAIWAFNPLDQHYIYVGQIWKAIHHYESLLQNNNVILAGDFNSNVLWDKPGKRVNHTDLVSKLSSLNISSSYHSFFNIKHGAELHPTFYLYRHKRRPYHLDYCFASDSLIQKLEHVEVSSHRKWAKYSDHVPLVTTFNY